MLGEVIAAAALGIWLYLLAARGGFWLCQERDEKVPDAPAKWPSVVAVIPARNEAECVTESIGSLARQDYPGLLSIILVDDDSDDDTATVARRAIADAGPAADRSFKLIRSRHLAAGWTGKLWALKQGADAAKEMQPEPVYFLFSDADIVHSPDSVRALVARAEAKRYVLTSLMAKLRCQSFAERSHVPAFVFFFQMLFPFAWVNASNRTTAAAAGGCMLVRSDILLKAGGLESVCDALIDDCALAEKLRMVGPIWLGLTERVHSIRRYDTLGEVGRMISRTAYAQLRYSPMLLAATTLGMGLTFLAGPFAALWGGGAVRLLGLLSWGLMALAFQPMLRFYRVSPLWGLALPAIAVAYMVYTFESAWRYASGQGGRWKGRIQANVSC